MKLLTTRHHRITEAALPVLKYAKYLHPDPKNSQLPASLNKHGVWNGVFISVTTDGGRG